MNRDNLPTRNPDEFPETYERRDTSVRGVLLAAGTSSRYGESNKLLEEVDGKALVRHAAETLTNSRLDDVTVVVGHERDRVIDALEGLSVTIRKNPSYAKGQSTSVQTGVRDAISRDADAVLVALGDMPWVTSETVDLLVDAYERSVADILAAGYEGKRGNPVLFDSRFFERLAGVDGDTGGRQLLRSSGEAVIVETDDPGVLRDVDRPEDLDR